MSAKPHFFERAKAAMKSGITMFGMADVVVDPRLKVEWRSVRHEAMQQGQRLQGLLSDPGFKIFIEELQARESDLLVALRSAPLTEVVRLQAQLEELQRAISLVPNAVEGARAAMRDLDTDEAEDIQNG